MAFLTGYSYRKNITLSRASGAVTNYQMKLLVGESSGATGENVDCGGKCLSSFNDIRFTKSDGTTLLDYWIESVSGTTPNQLATIWIEFDSIGTGATSFYMYYGNPSATAVSSGANTFLFFDDFPGSSIDTDKWYHWYDLGSYSVASSILTVTGGSSVYEAWGCKSKYGNNNAYRGRVRCTQDGVYGTGADVGIFGFDDRSANGSPTGSGADQARIAGETPKYWVTGIENSYSNQSRTDTFTDWAIAEIQWNSTTNVQFLKDDSLKQTNTTQLPVDNGGLVVYSNRTQVSVEWDWVLVRQWLKTEPAWGTWGNEESPTLLSKIMGISTANLSKFMGITKSSIKKIGGITYGYSWYTSYNQGSSWTYGNNGQNMNFRMIYSASDITMSGSKIRLTIKAHNSQSCPIAGVSIGERSGSTVGMVSSPTRVTFDGGSSSVNVAAGVDKVSDEIDFVVDETKQYLVHIFQNQGGNNYCAYAYTGGRYYIASSNDDTMVQTPTGYNTSQTSGYTGYISKIEVYT